MRVGSDGGEVLDDFLGRFCLAGAGLAGDEDRLVLALVAHVDPCALGDGEDVGRVLVATFAAVGLDDGVCVELEGLVWVYGDEEEAGVGLRWVDKWMWYYWR